MGETPDWKGITFLAASHGTEVVMPGLSVNS